MRIFQKSRTYIDVDERDTESTHCVTGEKDVGMYHEYKGQHNVNNNSFENQHAFPRNAFKEECGNVNSKSERYTANQNENPKNKHQSIVTLVRKLNCTSSKKHDFEETTRPVLITVKTEEENTSILSTVGDSSSPSRRGVTARKRQYSPKDKERSRRCGGWPSSNHQDIIDGRRTPQEVARRERWKRGFEMEKRMFKNNSRGRARDDTYSMGSQTTGTSGTGYSSTEDSSSNDDWTDATEESYSSPKYYRQQYGQNASGGHCTSSQIAEDFGIFADLLLSDGYACFGTAAAITKETVGECRGNNARFTSSRTN